MATADSPFRGKVMVVAGATGCVGGALAARLVAEGALVAAPVRKGWQVARVEAALREAGAGADQTLVGVVPSGDGEAAPGFAKGVVDSLGPVAGFLGAIGSFGSADAGQDPVDQAPALMAANHLAVVNLLRPFLGRMLRQGSGRVVLFGSALVGGEAPGMAHYRAAKGALHEYGAALRAEVVGRGVAVTTLRLGTIDTPANRNAMPDTDRSSWHAVDAVVDGALRCCRPDAGDLPAFLSL